MRHLLAVTALVGMVSTAACGGSTTSDGAASPSTPVESPSRSDDLEGSYAASSVRQASTFDGEEVGPASAEDIEFAFTCADDGCTRIFQRSDARTGRTRLLEVSASTWTSVTVTEGPCTPPATGTYTEEDAFEWTRAEDGSMVGDQEYVFTGCGLDGSRTTAYTVTGRTGDLPYTTGDEAAALKELITDFDDAAKPQYAAFGECDQARTRGETAVAGACYAQLFASLATALTALDAALAARPVSAPRGACERALEAMSDPDGGPSAKTRTAYEDLVSKYDAAAASNDYSAVAPAFDAAVALGQEQFQPAFVALATQCLAPDDLEGLGEDGVLATDSQGLIKPRPSS